MSTPEPKTRHILPDVDRVEFVDSGLAHSHPEHLLVSWWQTFPTTDDEIGAHVVERLVSRHALSYPFAARVFAMFGKGLLTKDKDLLVQGFNRMIELAEQNRDEVLECLRTVLHQAGESGDEK